MWGIVLSILAVHALPAKADLVYFALSTPMKAAFTCNLHSEPCSSATGEDACHKVHDDQDQA